MYCAAGSLIAASRRRVIIQSEETPMTSEEPKESPGKAGSPEEVKRAEEAFIRGLLERGEAAKADENGNLPPGATHEIIGVSESGLPIVRRRRYKMK